MYPPSLHLRQAYEVAVDYLIYGVIVALERRRAARQRRESANAGARPRRSIAALGPAPQLLFSATVIDDLRRIRDCPSVTAMRARCQLAGVLYHARPRLRPPSSKPIENHDAIGPESTRRGTAGSGPARTRSPPEQHNVAAVIRYAHLLLKLPLALNSSMSRSLIRSARSQPRSTRHLDRVAGKPNYRRALAGRSTAVAAPERSARRSRRRVANSAPHPLELPRLESKTMTRLLPSPSATRRRLFASVSTKRQWPDGRFPCRDCPCSVTLRPILHEHRARRSS